MSERLTPVTPITPANPVSPNTDTQLQPRYIGPVGNRVSAVAGIPGDHLLYYAGAASGGVFKTTDGGLTWQPVFDGQAAALEAKPLPVKVSSIGALAVSESNHDIVWAGTGESWIRGPISIGNGIYKTIDGGANWTHMGLDETGRFSKIVIHPGNPDIVWAAAVGSCYNPSEHRGVFKTTDGGLTWRRTLHTNDETGCSDICIDPNNPAILYAGMWQFKLRSWIRVSGGPGGGLYKSVDGGETWAELTKGLPTENHQHVVGKISVGVARSDSDYIYANIETGDGEPTWDFPDPANGQLWQSTDAGENWTLKNYDRSINSRAAYYTRNVVSPDNKHEVYFFGPKLVKTIDGGETVTTSGFPQAPGVDHHQGWIDPTNGDRIAVASDMGISISQNRGQTWYKIALPISQMYNVSVDDEIPYNVFGNCQDKLANWGPSNTRMPYNVSQGGPVPGRISRGAWKAGGSGECGYSIPDPKDPDLIWSTGSTDGPNGGSIALINRRTGHWRVVTIKPDFTTGSAPKDVAYRFHWHLPLAVSPHDNPEFPDRPRPVYAGSQYVHSTEDHGQSWQQITDRELTGCDHAYLQSSGGLTGDNLNVRMAYTLSAITESPLEPGLLWVGTSDQRVWLGRKMESGWDWQELNLEHIQRKGQLPAPRPGAWAMVSCIAPSRHQPGTAYVSFDRHQAGDTKPYVFKTTDYGKHWDKITNGIPHSVVSYVHWLAEDPACPGLLFLGTENALYVSFDDGADWQVLPGLPPAPVSGIVVQENFSDLVVSTFGRGFWIFDDITPLRQLADLGDQDVYLFEMSRPIYRFQDIAQTVSIPHDNDPTIGINPPSPAPINFYLKSAAKSLKITVLDENNEVVRTISNLSGVKGINRVWWDLQSNPTETIKLRTNPANQKNTQYCPSGIRPYSNPVVGTSFSWLVPPGVYQVQIEVDGETIQHRREIVVSNDPNARPELTDDEALIVITEQIALSKKIWGALNTVSNAINVIEFICFQIEQLEKWIENQQALDLISKLNKDIRMLEDSLMQRKITGHGEDLARFPAQLVENLVYLGSLAAGMGDFRPTDSQYELYDKLQNEVGIQAEQLEQSLVTIELEINPALQSLGVPTLLIDPPDSELCALFDTGPAF